MIPYRYEASIPHQQFNVPYLNTQEQSHNNNEAIDEKIYKSIRITENFGYANIGKEDWDHYEIGKKLTLADQSRHFVRLTPPIGSPMDWSKVPVPTHRSADEKSLSLIDIKDNKLIFYFTNGGNAHPQEFDIENNDGDWMPTHAYKKLLMDLWHKRMINSPDYY